MTDYPFATVGGLIVAPDGDVFLVKSDKWRALYTVPGGKIDEGETREAAFHREIWEETHLKITNIRPSIVQDCIYSPEFWQKRHFVMNDYIADLHPDSKKEDVILNYEAQSYVWINPEKALDLPLHKECRILIEWYLHHLQNKKWLGLIGIEHHRIPCIIGVLPKERVQEQELFVDVKVKWNFAPCMRSESVQDTLDYVQIADVCTELAQTNKYQLLETFAADILAKLNLRFYIPWGWVRIKKPSAIPSAHYAVVELERNFEETKWSGL